MAGGSQQIDLVGLKRQKLATKTIVADAAGTLTSVFRQLRILAGSARAANPELQPLPSPLHRKRLHQISRVLSATLQNPGNPTHAAAARGLEDARAGKKSGETLSLDDSVRRRFSLVGGGSLGVGQRLGIVPRHPGGRIECNGGHMALQGDEVVERLDLVQFRGMNQAHEQIADPRTVQGPIEQRVLPMQDRLLEDSLTNVMPTAGLCRVRVAH